MGTARTLPIVIVCVGCGDEVYLMGGKCLGEWGRLGESFGDNGFFLGVADLFLLISFWICIIIAVYEQS